MKQGRSVIVDSTCNYQQVLDSGSALARRHGSAYWYVECRVRDVELLDRRLRARDPMASQRGSVDCLPVAAGSYRAGEDARALFERWIDNPCRPQDGAVVVVVDSTGDPEELRDRILQRIRDSVS